MEDEAWRDGLEDETASRLLDWALGLTDASLARRVGLPESKVLDAGPPAEAQRGACTAPDAYAVADQARRLLDAVAGRWRGQGPEDVAAAVASLLGPPLFESFDDGQRAIQVALTEPAAVAEHGGASAAPDAPEDQPGASAVDSRQDRQQDRPQARPSDGRAPASR